MFNALVPGGFSTGGRLAQSPRNGRPIQRQLRSNMTGCNGHAALRSNGMMQAHHRHYLLWLQHPLSFPAPRRCRAQENFNYAKTVSFFSCTSIGCKWIKEGSSGAEAQTRWHDSRTQPSWPTPGLFLGTSSN